MIEERLTPTELEHLLSLMPADVMSVYSGKAHRCCCGCSGNHRYAAAHRNVASKHRGYTVEDKEVNDVQVRRVLRILQKNAGTAHGGGGHFAVVIGERLYVVYLLPARS